MPKRTDIKSILIIGAGPIVIGQACEFDYSGAQACKALREEGFGILLVSTELDEILALSDRVVVMSQGEITGELPIHDCDEVKLGLLMTGSAHPQSEPEPEREES